MFVFFFIVQSAAGFSRGTHPLDGEKRMALMTHMGNRVRIFLEPKRASSLFGARDIAAPLQVTRRETGAKKGSTEVGFFCLLLVMLPNHNWRLVSGRKLAYGKRKKKAFLLHNSNRNNNNNAGMIFSIGQQQRVGPTFRWPKSNWRARKHIFFFFTDTAHTRTVSSPAPERPAWKTGAGHC